MTLPPGLVRRMTRSAEGARWIASLPRLIEECFDTWGLRLDLSPGFPVLHGYSGIVLPVRGRDGAAVLKVSLPVEETLSEGPSLRVWQGRGAVRVLEEEPARCALLLERLEPHRTLISMDLHDAAEVWGGIVRGLSVPVDEVGRILGDTPALAAIPRLSDMAERWCDEFPQSWQEAGEPFPRWLLEAALEVCQVHGTVGRRESREVLVHQDLHFLNILARPGGPDSDGPGGQDTTEWVAIDPQAVLGDAEFSLPPVLRNRLAEYPVVRPAEGVLRRLEEYCEAAGLDPELTRQWSVVSFVEDALWFATKGGHDAEKERSLWLASALAGNVLDDTVDPRRLHDPGHVD
ncbi:streptomycin 6-kinase [Arthrobacter woluwensis]|nr:streptomycin 6-kinase [Arthrobacter woluwensis]